MSDELDQSPEDLDEAGAAIASATNDDIEAADSVAAAAAASLASAADEDRDRKGVYWGWAFLAIMFAIFLALVLWSWNLDDGASEDLTPTVTAGAETEAGAELTPTSLLFTVSADGSVVLTGSVPDEGARRQIVDAATDIYGQGSVTDELSIDDSTTLAGGTVNTAGTAPHEDQNIGALVSAAGQLGLSEGTLGAGFGDQELIPVAATVALATDRAVLTGAFPEQGALDLFVKSATDVFGEANVDSSDTFVDSSTTMDGATIVVTGLLDAGDTRGQGMMSAFGDSFPGLTIDSSGLAVDNSAEALGRLEDKLRASIELNPILFETGSANIDAASDAILEEAAAAIMATPGIPVEVVGHTDSQGSEEANQALSEARANAVLARLVELGVDAEGLTARGAGEAEPVADNTTDEGRAANRRIAFEFEGATN